MSRIKNMGLWTVYTDTDKTLYIDADCASVDPNGVLSFIERRRVRNIKIISFAPGAWRAFFRVGGYGYGNGNVGSKFINGETIQEALSRRAIQADRQ
jgi:hypothetical protein